MFRGAPITRVKQDGIALVIFVIMLALASVTYTLANVSIEQLRKDKARSTQSVLNKAKRALLDYAAMHEDSNPGEFGFLPCPDYLSGGAVPEGGSDSNCGGGGENILGLFPWASMETGILKSGSGQCLWYGISGEYRSSPKTTMLNEDTNGAMRLFDADGVIKQGALAQDRIVAVIIDPSNVLPGQSRSIDDGSLCGKDYSSAQYLEGNGAINNSLLSGGFLAIDNFITRGVGTDELAIPFNDQLVYITREELWDAVRSRQDFIDSVDSAIRRQTHALAMCIANYGNNSGNRKLPRPAAVNFSGADYREDINYNDTVAVSYLGRYPHTVNKSDEALGVYAPNDANSILFDKGFCDALIVPGGDDINLNTVTQAEGYTAWKNWKDHFFYAVSSHYAPANIAGTTVPACNGSNCVVVTSGAVDVEYAAVVLFAGRRTGAQVRNEPFAGDIDTKNILANYIEVNNSIGDGTGNYTPTDNDIAFCITDENPFTVVSCP